jgi:hypothetical protein
LGTDGFEPLFRRPEDSATTFAFFSTFSFGSFWGVVSFGFGFSGGGSANEKNN